MGGGAALAGLLIVTVRRAKDLVNADTFSSSDPFCQLEIGKDHQKTKTIDNNNSPEWNQVFKFMLATPETDVLHVKV